MAGISNYKVLVGQLGKFKISGSCLHINRLADVDPKVLKELIVTAFHDFKERVKNKA